MPLIQDLNAFKNTVNQLADEPQVLAGRGDVIEDIDSSEPVPVGVDIFENSASEPEQEARIESDGEDEAVSLEEKAFSLSSEEEVEDLQTLLSEEENRAADAGGASLSVDERIFEDLEPESPEALETDSSSAFQQALSTGFDQLKEDLPASNIMDNEGFFPREPAGWDGGDSLPDELGLGDLFQDEPVESPPSEKNNSEDSLKDQNEFEEELFRGARPQEEETEAETGHVLKDEALQILDEAFETQQVDLFNILDRSFDLNELRQDETDLENSEFEISVDNVQKFLTELSMYPISLKIGVEEAISKQDLDSEAVENLVEMVIDGVPASRIANYLFSLTGKRIVLLKGQERRFSGFSQEKWEKSFLYQLYHYGWPILFRYSRISFLALAGFTIISYFVYRPIQAWYYYRKGYEAIFEDNFVFSEENFQLASRGWPVLGGAYVVKGVPSKQWYRDYSLAYAARKDFQQAVAKMDETIHRYPNFREAWFDYISLLFRQMADYQGAVALVEQYKDLLGNDYEILVLTGDIYLAWGEQDLEKYDLANKYYTDAQFMQKNRDLTLLLSLLDYYLRTVFFNGSERHKGALEDLLRFFTKINLREIEISGEKRKILAKILSTGADYKLNQGDYEFAKNLLSQAMKLSDYTYEVYKVYSKYYSMIGDQELEKETLNMSLFFLRYRDDKIYNGSLNIQEQFYTFAKAAKLTLEVEQNWKKSSMFYLRALALHNANRLRRLSIDSWELSDLYFQIGNVYFRNPVNQFNAMYFYQKARALNAVENVLLSYRYGYLLYQNQNYQKAVEEFFKSQRIRPDNFKIGYALGNSSLQLGNIQIALGLLRGLYSEMQEMLRINQELLDPQNSVELRDLLFMLVRTANDIGVTLYYQGLGMDHSKIDLASAYFIQAIEYLDILSRETFSELKLSPELLFRPDLLNEKALERLERSSPEPGLAVNSLPDRNIKAVLRGGASPLRRLGKEAAELVRPYPLTIVNPFGFEEEMDY